VYYWTNGRRAIGGRSERWLTFRNDGIQLQSVRLCLQEGKKEKKKERRKGWKTRQIINETKRNYMYTYINSLFPLLLCKKNPKNPKNDEKEEEKKKDTHNNVMYNL
jgi:hypothetical protein